MVPLFDRPVMEHCIKLLARHGITDITVTVSHLARGILQYFGDGSRWGVRIRYSVEHEPLGTAGGVKLVQSSINGTFIVISGDAVTDVDLTSAVARHRSASAVATLMLYEVNDPTSFGLVQHDPDGKITRFLEKPRSTEVFTNTVNTGIYVLEPEVLSCIPHGVAFDFARDLFPRMLNNREPLYGFRLPGYWCDVGNLIQYRSAHFDALRGKVALDLPASRVGEDLWMGEGVEVHPSASLSTPLFLGTGVVVRRGARLGERTVVGAQTVIDEEARVSRSVIGGGSYIGRDARITDCIIGSGYSLVESGVVDDRILVPDATYQTVPVEPVPAHSSSAALSQVAQEQIGRQQQAA